MRSIPFALRLLAITVLAGWPVAAACAAQLTVAPVTAHAGEKVTLTFSTDSPVPVALLSFSVTIDPSVATPVAKDGSAAAVRGVGAVAGKPVVGSIQGGKLDIVLPASNAPISIQGPVVEADFLVSPSAVPGHAAITLSDPEAFQSSGDPVPLTAVNGDLTLVAGPPPSTLAGDVTGDGKVDVRDAVLVLQQLVHLTTLMPDQMKRADISPVNPDGSIGDGKVDIRDAIRILRIAVGLESALPGASGPTSAIGPAGGVVSSPDGRVTLTVPPGALDRTVQVGIAPQPNSIPRGVGPAYTLTPDGLTLKTAASLALKYTDDMVDGSAPQGLGVAFRQNGGPWQAVTGGSVDTAARTLTVPITHFSDWGAYQAYKMEGGSGQILTRDKMTFFVTTEGAPLAAPGRSPFPIGNETVRVEVNDWSVNGVVGGSASLGTLTSHGSNQGLGEALYVSPGKMPAANPVAISSSITTADLGKIILVRNLIVARRWQLYLEYSFFSRCPAECCFGDPIFTQTANAIVEFELGPNFQVASSTAPRNITPILRDVGVCPEVKDHSVASVILGSGGLKINGLKGGYSSSTKKLVVGLNWTIPDSPALQVRDVSTGAITEDIPPFPHDPIQVDYAFDARDNASMGTTEIPPHGQGDVILLNVRELTSG